MEKLYLNQTLTLIFHQICTQVLKLSHLKREYIIIQYENNILGLGIIEGFVHILVIFGILISSLIPIF